MFPLPSAPRLVTDLPVMPSSHTRDDLSVQRAIGKGLDVAPFLEVLQAERPDPEALLLQAIQLIVHDRSAGRDKGGDIFTVAKEYAATFHKDETEYDKQQARGKFARNLSAACRGELNRGDLLDEVAYLYRLDMKAKQLRRDEQGA